MIFVLSSVCTWRWVHPLDMCHNRQMVAREFQFSIWCVIAEVLVFIYWFLRGHFVFYCPVYSCHACRRFHIVGHSPFWVCNRSVDAKLLAVESALSRLFLQKSPWHKALPHALLTASNTLKYNTYVNTRVRSIVYIPCFVFTDKYCCRISWQQTDYFSKYLMPFFTRLLLAVFDHIVQKIDF